MINSWPPQQDEQLLQLTTLWDATTLWLGALWQYKSLGWLTKSKRFFSYHYDRYDNAATSSYIGNCWLVFFFFYGICFTLDCSLGEAMTALHNNFPIGESLLPVTAIKGGMLLTKLFTYAALRCRDHALPLSLWKPCWPDTLWSLFLAGYLKKANKVGFWFFFAEAKFSAECILLLNVYNKINSLINLHAQRNAAG